MLPPLSRHAYGLLAAVIAVAGCSTAAYTPRPLDPDGAAAERAKRTPGTDGLHQFALANGHQGAWPPQSWRLRELTLTALYFHPDIRTARARAAVARAELTTASRPAEPLSARLKPEYHSRSVEEDSGPWSLGFELEIPLVRPGKLAARAERGAFLADAADLDIALAAWQVRSRVRDRVLDLQRSRERLALLDLQFAARDEMLGLVERRVEAGMLSMRDLGTERALRAQLAVARDREAAGEQQAVGALAAALALPLEVVRGMEIAFPVPEYGAPLPADELRRLALRNRLDVHRRLLEFGAADAEMKFAVAAQNPDIQLGPGYAWDQGDNIWSLAIGMTLPSAARARSAIREAQARRELAAQLFLATQAGAIGDAEQAAGGFGAARERMAGAERQSTVQREQEARVMRQFEAGAADRLQRATARIETLAAQAALLDAQADVRDALARLEDAVQRPLLGDFDILPNAGSAPLSEVEQR